MRRPGSEVVMSLGVTSNAPISCASFGTNVEIVGIRCQKRLIVLCLAVAATVCTELRRSRDFEGTDMRH